MLLMKAMAVDKVMHLPWLHCRPGFCHVQTWPCTKRGLKQAAWAWTALTPLHWLKGFVPPAAPLLS